MLSIVGEPNAPLQPLWPSFCPSFCPSNVAELLPMLFPLPGFLLPPPPPILSQLAPSQHAGPSLKALSIVRSLLPTQPQLASLNRDLLHHKSLLYDFSEHLLLHKINFPV